MGIHPKEEIELLKNFVSKHFPHLRIFGTEEEINYKCKPDLWCIDTDLKDIFFEYKSPHSGNKKYHATSKLPKGKAQAKKWFERNPNLKIVIVCGVEGMDIKIFYLLRKEDVAHITYKQH